MQKRWEITRAREDLIEDLSSSLGLGRAAAMLLSARQIDAGSAKSFLNPLLSSLSDPFELPGVERASARLWKAVGDGEKIVIHGDYDADGLTAATLLYSVLLVAGADVRIFIPDRFEDGYGLSVESASCVLAEGCDVLVTVDCGISSIDAAEFLFEREICLIVTDHHDPASSLPRAFCVIDPKLHPEHGHLLPLAGVGVAFKLSHGFVKYGREKSLGAGDTDLKTVLDLVALGTVADVVPLVGENRILVSAGLKQLALQRRPGIKALCDVAGIDIVNTGKIAFGLAPRINAAGRMENAEPALKLLSCKSIATAFRDAELLEGYNRERQKIEEHIFNEAVCKFPPEKAASRFSVTVAGKSWNPGVIGIVASRLVREYYRPAVVIAIDDEGNASGSCRSIPELNILEALDQCAEHLESYGGHPMAAGLRIRADKIDEFRERFEEASETRLEPESLVPKIKADGEISLCDLDPAFFSILKRIEPFGQGNPKPVFKISGLKINKVSPAGKKHSRGVFSDERGISLPFIAFGFDPASFGGSACNAMVSPQINRFRGFENPQLQVIDYRMV